MSQKPTFEQLLPIVAEEGAEGNQEVSDYILEPSREDLLAYLLPKTVNFKVFSALLENATTNGNKLIDTYTTLRNRARQAAITTELTEIVAGAESLK